MTANASPQPMLPDRVFFVACAVIFLASAALRIVPAFGDFWLDEIWSYFSVQSVHGAWEIFDGIHDSNNHHLYSLLLYWMGDRENLVLYRIPSLAAGIASVALAFALGRRQGRLEAIFAGLLVGFCFALIFFSSEARGYSLAVFFALATTWLLDRERDRPSALVSVAISACMILGVLSHLTFLFFVAGAFAQSLARLARRRAPPARAALTLAALYVPTLLAVAALTWVDLRVMRVGGGNPINWPLLASQSVGYTLGLPVAAALAWPALACAAVIGVAAGRISWREGDEDWLLVLVTAVVAPALVLGVTRPEVVELRYFVIGIALYLVLVGRLAAALFRAGGWRRVACAVGLALFAIGNAAHTLPFLRYGRGGYQEAVRFMAESSPNAAFTVGSDHDFRNEMILRFYARELPKGRSLIYADVNATPRNGPDWVIVHAAERPDSIPPSVTDRLGNSYVFAREFEKGAISGFWWGVYRNAAPAGAASAPSAASTAPQR